MASDPQTGTSSSRKPSLSDVGRSAARYLFAIAMLSGSGSDRVATGELQEYLDVAPASVTGMVSKLADRGLIEYETYQGVTLADRGETLAARAGWRFCVVSTFFDSVLGTTLDEEIAFDIGIVLPKRGVFRLRSLADSACLDLCPESSDDADRGVA